jgi:hypothetical protein
MANSYGGNERPPLHEHRRHLINNYAGVAFDFPLQEQAAAPALVCTNLTFPHARRI